MAARGASAELGIRYARAERFGAPEVVPWTGESLGAFGPPPPQPERPISRFAHGSTPAGAEDCLFVNVWTPTAGRGPFPVLVWSIGGGWTIGWAGSPLYDGAALAAAAQAVVVTFTYRLGSLGWLAEPVPNLGLRDHVAVLRWVREHIAAFGGDPARVTMGGQSAGAANVADLLCCPAAEGLFARAILHSPPLPEAANDPSRGRRWAAALAARVAGSPTHDALAARVAGSPAADLAALRDAPAEAIVAAHEALLAEPEWRGTRGAAWPALDPETLPCSPLDRPDARLDVPVLVGTTRDEATFLFRTGGRDAPDEQVERVTRELFTAPTQRWARERAAAGGRVHLFRLDHGSPDPRLGALHTVDVPLLFGTYACEVGGHYLADDADTRRVSAWMQEQWGRFLHGQDPEWPAGELTTVDSSVYSSSVRSLLADALPVTVLPGEPVPYVIEAGSGRAHVLLGEVGRALVGAEESAGAMSVMALDGPRAERPIPLHYHDNEYEFFYILRGHVQLWADDDSRVLAPGDFGFIPPGTLHAYQLRGHFSTFVGPIVPGGWDRFFDLTGEPFPGPCFPTGPKGPPPFEKFGRAEVEFKMKYRPDAQYAPARPDAPDDTLPAGEQAYFLRCGEGPRHALCGQLQTLLVGADQTSGKLTMTTVELAKGPGLPAHVHEHTHEALTVVEGRLQLTLDGAEHTLCRGDTASIPAGTEHAYRGDGHYTKILTMSAPGGLEKLIATAGEETAEHVFGAQSALDSDALREAAAGLDVVLV